MIEMFVVFMAAFTVVVWLVIGGEGED